MLRSPIEDLLGIEGAQSDPGLVSATIVKLIYASREFEVKLYDNDTQNGTYVVVIEGTLDIAERGTIGEGNTRAAESEQKEASREGEAVAEEPATRR
jgi:hypothetical protein